jgi:hypothetical protein
MVCHNSVLHAALSPRAALDVNRRASQKILNLYLQIWPWQPLYHDPGDTTLPGETAHDIPAAVALSRRSYRPRYGVLQLPFPEGVPCTGNLGGFSMHRQLGGSPCWQLIDFHISSIWKTGRQRPVECGIHCAERKSGVDRFSHVFSRVCQSLILHHQVHLIQLVATPRPTSGPFLGTILCTP